MTRTLLIIRSDGSFQFYGNLSTLCKEEHLDYRKVHYQLNKSDKYDTREFVIYRGKPIRGKYN